MGARFHRLFYLQNRRMIIGNCHKKDIERRFRINELTSIVPYAVRSVLWNLQLTKLASNDSEASFFSVISETMMNQRYGTWSCVNQVVRNLP